MLKALWNDEVGTLMSLETVMLATVGTLAVTGAVSQLASSVNSELGDLSAAVLSFDQSYSTTGYTINGNVQGGSSASGGSANSARFFASKSPSGFQQQNSGGVNFGSAAPQGFQQQNFSVPNFSAEFFVDEIAGDTAPRTNVDPAAANQPNVRVQPRSNSNLRAQPQASGQQGRLREQVVIEEVGDDEDASDFELQTIVVPRNRRNSRANTF